MESSPWQHTEAQIRPHTAVNNFTQQGKLQRYALACSWIAFQRLDCIIVHHWASFTVIIELLRAPACMLTHYRPKRNTRPDTEGLPSKRLAKQVDSFCSMLKFTAPRVIWISMWKYHEPKEKTSAAHSQEWSISNLQPCSLTRITTWDVCHVCSMKNLAFHRLLRWKTIIQYCQILTASLIHLKDDYTTNSHYLTHTFLFRKVGRTSFLNLGVKGVMLHGSTVPWKSIGLYSRLYWERSANRP